MCENVFNEIPRQREKRENFDGEKRTRMKFSTVPVEITLFDPPVL